MMVLGLVLRVATFWRYRRRMPVVMRSRGHLPKGRKLRSGSRHSNQSHAARKSIENCIVKIVSGRDPVGRPIYNTSFPPLGPSGQTNVFNDFGMGR